MTVPPPWVPPPVDYEREYGSGRNPFGPIIPEFERFFNELPPVPLKTLDLGCGQGRDAVVAAAKGHPVVGIDCEYIGVSQMMERAREANLPILGIVADVLTFEPRGLFDVVILGYVLHTLSDENQRWGSNGLFQMAVRHVAPAGYLLVSETGLNVATAAGLLEKGFAGAWALVRKTDKCVISRRA